MKKLKKYLLYLGIALLVVSCGEGYDKSTTQSASPLEALAPTEAVEYLGEEAAQEEVQTEAPESKVYVQQSAIDKETPLVSGILSQQDTRPFILTANVDFQTKDVYETAILIENLAYKLGGFVLKNDINNSITNVTRTEKNDQTIIQTTRYTTKGHLVIRVPTDKTQQFLRKLKPYIDYLEKRDFTAYDASFDFLRVKLLQQRAQETQQNLSQAIKQNKKIDTLSAIDSQNLAKEMRDEAVIKQASYKDQTKFSTINLSIGQAEKVHNSQLENIDNITKQHQPEFLFQVKEGLSNGWAIVIAIVLFFINIWPITIIVLISGMIGFKHYRKTQNMVKPEQPRKAMKGEVDTDSTLEKND